MWRTMMRVWLLGTVMTLGVLDGFPETVDHPLVVRTADGAEIAADGVFDLRPDLDAASRAEDGAER
jgi:hypothetical protein